MPREEGHIVEEETMQHQRISEDYKEPRGHIQFVVGQEAKVVQGKVLGEPNQGICSGQN